MKLSLQNYELSRNQKISDSDLCDNELSDFKDDENKSVKTLKPYQLEPEQEVAEADTDESEIKVFKKKEVMREILKKLDVLISVCA